MADLKPPAVNTINQVQGDQSNYNLNVLIGQGYRCITSAFYKSVLNLLLLQYITYVSALESVSNQSSVPTSIHDVSDISWQLPEVIKSVLGPKRETSAPIDTILEKLTRDRQLRIQQAIELRLRQCVTLSQRHKEQSRSGTSLKNAT